MILEICYTYQQDKHSEIENSYTYFHTDKEDFKDAIGDASKHFKKFLTSNGWTRKAKLKEIKLINNEDTPFPVIRVDPEPKPRKRRSKGTSKTQSSRTSRTQKTKT